MIRRLVHLIPVVLLLSCGGTETPAESEEDGRTPADVPEDRRDTLVIAWLSGIGSLNPAVSEAASDSAIWDAKLLFPLAEADFDCSMKKKPALATSWEWSEDGKILSMTLRDDITWYDGTPVTPKDIQFTYDLLGDTTVGSPRFSYVQRMTEDGRPKIVDDTHIEWHFTEAYDRDTQFAHASLTPIPAHLLSEADRGSMRGNEFSKTPVPSGPFKITKHEPNSTLVLEPNEYFTGPAELHPKLNRVIIKVIPEYATRLLELQNGTVDMMEGITVADADMLQETNPNIRLERRGWRFMDYIVWNLEDPKFQDKNVRVALAHAVDINGLIDKQLTSKSGDIFGRPSVGTVSPTLCGVHNDDIVPLAYDVDKAKAMLAEAGWVDADGDGILDKDGQPFEFTLKTNAGNTRRAETQVIVQDQLKQVGVKVTLAQEESNAFFKNLREKKFEAALGGWSAALFVDPTSLWHSNTDDKVYKYNYAGYSNPKADALMDQGLQTPLPSEAAPIWRELQQVIYDDQPYMFLYWRDEIVGIDNRFENTKIDILTSLHDLHAWSVPEDKVKYQR